MQVETKNIDWMKQGHDIKCRLYNALKDAKWTDKSALWKGDRNIRFDTFKKIKKYQDDEAWAFPYGHIERSLNLDIGEYVIKIKYSATVEQGDCFYDSFYYCVKDKDPYKGYIEFYSQDYVSDLIEELFNTFRDEGAVFYFSHAYEKVRDAVIDTIIYPLFDTIKEVSWYKDVMRSQPKNKIAVKPKSMPAKRASVNERRRAARAYMRECMEQLAKSA